LSKLTNEQRVAHYLRLSRSLGLNPLSRPFDWIQFDGKLALYPNQSCAAQLRRQHQIRIEVTRREPVGEMFCVEVKGTTPDGREDFATKYVPLSNKYGRLAGQDYANALMKCETGAKRRLTFSMVGLAVPPDPEEATVGWKPVIVDGTGMVIRHPSPEQRYLAEHPTAAAAIGEPVFEDAPIPEDDQSAVSQAVRPEELERPKQPRARPTFRPTKEQVDAWLRAWFAAVKGSSLEPDDARARYTRQWTAGEGWPEGKQTDSLRMAFGRMTEREAADFLAHVRALVEDEKRANEEALAEAQAGGSSFPASHGAANEEAF
jgi:hypothetical protein